MAPLGETKPFPPSDDLRSGSIFTQAELELAVYRVTKRTGTYVGFWCGKKESSFGTGEVFCSLSKQTSAVFRSNQEGQGVGRRSSKSVDRIEKYLVAFAKPNQSPGKMVRNAGKFGKAKRGGGRHFSRDLSRLGSDGEPVNKKNGSDSSSEESSSEEDDAPNPQDRIGQLPPIADSDSEDEAINSGLAANLNSTLSTAPLVPGEAPEPRKELKVTGQKLTAEEIAQARKDRKAGAKKASGKKVAGSGSEESEEENDNKRQGKALKVSSLGAPKEMSRREKEQADKKAAAERYAKLHAAGKTDEAKSDLSRLAEIRKEREKAAARRKAEAEAAAETQKAAMEKSGKKLR